MRSHSSIQFSLILTLLLQALHLVNGSQVPLIQPLSPQPYPPSESPALITPETHEFIHSLLSRWNSSGLSIAVVQKNSSAPTGWETDFGSYGVANGDGTPVSPSSLFAIASNSKLFLSLSVGLLISNDSLAEERRSANRKALKWTSKAADVFEGTGLWDIMDEDMRKGTNLQDMMSHRTGLPRHDYSGGPREGGVAEMISKLRHLRSSAEFRQTYQYNNLMYETLSHLPSLLLNQSYESYIAEHLFAPLNMSSATYSVAVAEKAGNLADGFSSYMRDSSAGRNGTLKATVPYFLRPGDEGVWAGAGGVLASAEDLAIWVKMLLNDGRHPLTNRTVVPAEVVKHVAEGVTVASKKPSHPELSAIVYGCGQQRYTYQGHELIEHGGHNPGYHTQIMRYPNDNVGIVVLSNDENAYRLIDIVKWRLSEDLLGLEHVDWESRFRSEHADLLAKQRATTPSPAALGHLTQAPAVSFSEMEGRYENPAYGAFDVCYVQPASEGSKSGKCAEIVAHPVVQRIVSSYHNSTTGENADRPPPTLILPFPKFFSTYIMLRHFDGNTFNASVVWSNWDVRQREGYANSTRLGGDEEEDEGDMITGLDDRYEVEWVSATSATSSDTALAGSAGGEAGWAFRGNFWGAGGDAADGVDGEMRGKKGREGAEVWFGRV